MPGVMHPVLPSREISVVAPFLKICLGPFRQEHAPGGLESGARQVERGCGAALMFAGMGSGIKPATPAPRIGVGWIPRADHDRADAHIALVDQPGHLWGVGVAAAGEGGHDQLKRQSIAPRNRPGHGFHLWNCDRQVAYRTDHMHIIPASPNSHCSHNECLPAPPKIPTGRNLHSASAGPPLAGPSYARGVLQSLPGAPAFLRNRPQTLKPADETRWRQLVFEPFMSVRYRRFTQASTA
jgi:hypothetical protein